MAATLLLIPGLGNTARLFRTSDRDLLAAHECAGGGPHAGRFDGKHGAAGILAGARAFALAGLSMGGYVAMEIMRQAPERVETAGSARHQRAARLAGSEAEPPAPDRTCASGAPERNPSPMSGRKLVHRHGRGTSRSSSVLRRMLRETGAAAYIRQQQSHHGHEPIPATCCRASRSPP